MDPLTIGMFVVGIAKMLAAYAIIFLAVWLVVELCRVVGEYLRNIGREIAVVYKRQALDDLIALASSVLVRHTLYMCPIVFSVSLCNQMGCCSMGKISI